MIDLELVYKEVEVGEAALPLPQVAEVEVVLVSLMVLQVEVSQIRVGVGPHSRISQPQNLGQRAEIHTPMMVATRVVVCLEINTATRTNASDPEDQGEDLTFGFVGTSRSSTTSLPFAISK